MLVDQELDDMPSSSTTGDDASEEERGKCGEAEEDQPESGEVAVDDTGAPDARGTDEAAGAPAE